MKPKVLLLQPMSEIQDNFVPLGLAYIAAVFRENNCQVKIIDASAPYANYSMEDIEKEVKEYKPDIVGITLTVIYAKYAYEILKRLSKNPDFLLMAGGPHASILPHEALEYGANIVVRGEGEETCLDILNYLRGKIKLEDILGISYRNEGGEFIDNPPRPLIFNLDSLPFPTKDLFKKEDFIRSPADFIRFSYVITGRGCPGNCAYCSNKLIWGRQVRSRSAKNIISEIELLIKNYGLGKIQFIDDSFTADRKKVDDICEKLPKKFPDLEWNCITRTDLVDFDLLLKMKKAGCSHINFGIESGDIETLKKINKGITPEYSEKVIKWTKESGITVGVNFMHGFPWETPAQLKKTRIFIKRIKGLVRDIMPGGIIVPYPGTAFYEEYKDKYGFEKWWLHPHTNPCTRRENESLRADRRLRLKGPGRRNPIAGIGVGVNPKKLKTAPPLFEKIFFYYDTLKYDYFNYPKEIVKEIKKTAFIIGRHNLLWYSKQVSSFPPLYYLIREPLFILVLISQILYKFSPALERIIMRPFLIMVTKREAAIRSKIDTNIQMNTNYTNKFVSLV